MGGKDYFARGVFEYDSFDDGAISLLKQLPESRLPDFGDLNLRAGKARTDCIVENFPGVSPCLTHEVFATECHDTVDNEEVFDCLGLFIDGLDIQNRITCPFFPELQLFQHLLGRAVFQSGLVSVPEHGGP